MNNTICKAFINHLCLTVEQEKIPCCRFIGKELIKQDNGWYTGCSKCYDEEQRNQKSYRQILNEQLSGKQGLEYLEFSLSSQCNLACKMCDPTYSTTWEKLCNQHQPLQEYKSNNNTKSISVKELFKNVDYSKLILIKYLGGEPFITPQLKELIYFLDQKNIANA